MQGIEQVFIVVMYLFWVLVCGFLFIAWRSGKREEIRPVIPITGKAGETAEKSEDEDIKGSPDHQANIDGRRK